jgi:hypothetical protein
LAQPLQLRQDLVEPLALDELHDVIVQPVGLADAEDRHDVRVVQPRRRLGLAAEAPQALLVQQGGAGQDLEGHVPAEGRLLRLVDDAHAAAAHLAQDAVVAQPPQRRHGRCGRGRGGLLVVLLALLHLDHGGEELADVAGELCVAVDVLLERGPLARPVARRELVGQSGEKDIVSGTGADITLTS